jgi:CAAX prenyl protease-like protein
MLVFVLFLAFNGLLKQPGASLWRARPELWIYPAQTIVCGALLFFFWRAYQFHPLRRPIFIGAIALLVFVFWIGPQEFLSAAPRLVGFDPTVVAADPAAYWSTLTLRFLRLVLVVPLVEEIFWRGLLLRYLISEKFETVPFGTFTWLSFAVVTVAFALSHAQADWGAALAAGALYNLVAYRTKSLTSCVAAHGLTNLLLGIWIVATGQWGFW